jgi:putative flippase GtrA
VVRYVINGLVATAVHYSVLTTNLQVFKMPSAGVANFFAAMAGICTSFLGSRYFVFRKLGEKILHQATKFGLLYALIACLHGALLYAWSDVMKLDYRIGFLMATGLQVVLSYWGNKVLVFRT